MGARVYIPSLGRFLQVDPVDGGTLNGYVYVADPINSSDYNGKWGFGDLFSAIVNVVKAVVKAVITPIVKIVNAVAQVAVAAMFYGAWTSGFVKSATVKTKEANITVSKPQLQAAATGRPQTIKADGASGGAYFFITGNVSGTFTGTVTKTSTGYRAVGTYKPDTNTYDFDLFSENARKRTTLGTVATVIGAAGGVASCVSNLFMHCPRDYEIDFDGSASVDMSW
jgi:hypothetical protein